MLKRSIINRYIILIKNFVIFDCEAVVKITENLSDDFVSYF